MAVTVSHKVLVRVHPDTYDRLSQLAYVPELEKAPPLVHPKDPDAPKNAPRVPRYAEIARVLLATELLSDAPLEVRVAAAVLANTTLIMSGEFARTIYALQSDLETVVAAASQTKTKTLKEALETGPKGTPNKRGSGLDKDPVLNITLDGWLYRAWTRYYTQHSVSQDKLDKAKMKSARLYMMCALLQNAVNQPDVNVLVTKYAKAVASIRQTILTAVTSERETMRTYLNRLK